MKKNIYFISSLIFIYLISFGSIAHDASEAWKNAYKSAVNPGASGAPLVNEHGQLVGMVDAIYTKEADIDAGVNFAIDKKLIQKFLKTRSGQIN